MALNYCAITTTILGSLQAAMVVNANALAMEKGKILFRLESMHRRKFFGLRGKNRFLRGKWNYFFVVVKLTLFIYDMGKFLVLRLLQNDLNSNDLTLFKILYS